MFFLAFNGETKPLNLGDTEDTEKDNRWLGPGKSSLGLCVLWAFVVKSPASAWLLTSSSESRKDDHAALTFPHSTAHSIGLPLYSAWR